jgi:hypothetical protein
MSMDVGMNPAASGMLAPPGTKAAPGAMKAYLQPGFIAAVVVLAAAAAALNFLVFNKDLHFKKLAVPLVRNLDQMPPLMGNWAQVSLDKPLDPDLQEVLGTDKYIFRDYLSLSSHDCEPAALFITSLYDDGDAKKPDEQALTKDLAGLDVAGRWAMLQQELKNKDDKHRQFALGSVQERFPDAAINMGVTYYTGIVDTVAHVPDRCYIADGFEPTDKNFPEWTLPNGRKMGVRFINFQDSSAKARVDRSVAYFFHVNGHYASDPLDVRISLQNLFEKYGYYAKVELMTLDPSDPDHHVSVATMTNFLNDSLGEVEKSLPDWNKLHTATK